MSTNTVVSSILANPHGVRVPGGSPFFVMDAQAPIPASFALIGTTAARKVAIRVTGGCSNMSQEDRLGMLAFFVAAFEGFQGIVWSGATRAFTADGLVDPMVTEVPAVVASGNPQCIALGTAPRIDVMRLVGDSQIVLDASGTGINPTLNAVLLVQNGSEAPGDWDGDLPTYFTIMKQWQEYAGFERIGIVSWNGGGVTEQEILHSIKSGWPTFLIAGSGRKTDEIAAKVMACDADLLETIGRQNFDDVVVISKDNPAGLRASFIATGFIVPH